MNSKKLHKHMLPVVIAALAVVTATGGVYATVSHKADAQSMAVSALATRPIGVHTTSPVSAHVAMRTQQAPQLHDAVFGAALNDISTAPALSAFNRN